MKTKYFALKAWLIGSVMSLLGFTSCHSNKHLSNSGEQSSEEPPVQKKERNEMRLMYGVPTMNYMIRGQVQSPNGEPIRNIRVNLLDRGISVNDNQIEGDPQAVREYLQNSEVATDEGGNFTINSNGRPLDEVRLCVRDVDGEENGSFADEVLVIPVEGEDIDSSKAEGWNTGTLNKSVVVKLKNK